MKLDVSDLIEQGLVTKKTYTDGKYAGLSVLKYHRKVFYDNLWHLDERLLECRGTVVDEDWNVIVLPFKKVFNLGENNTTVDPERNVIVPEKINGFMAAATMTEKYGLIVSTTGTLDSDYAILARKWIEKGRWGSMFKGSTYLFEICDKSDPHIVEEEEGAYLIGERIISRGKLISEYDLYVEAEVLNYKRPVTYECKFKDLPETKREGYMVRCADTHKTLCKIKSNHYLSKKALMRMGKRQANIMFENKEEFKKRLDEEFYNLLEYLTTTYSLEEYQDFKEQERRYIIEEYFKNENSLHS